MGLGERLFGRIFGKRSISSRKREGIPQEELRVYLHKLENNYRKNESLFQRRGLGERPSLDSAGDKFRELAGKYSNGK